DEYIKNFSADQRLLSDFFVYAIDNKVRPDEKSIHASRQLIANQLKANIGRLLFGNDAFYRVVLSDDKAFNAALQQAESTAQSKVKESEAK
ncbi:MAG TPA: hypothetical protein PLZ63_10045, partial [Bacteroidia bacterium]|nr:hypothetical protein [Bacteroidia bacterium]